MSASRTFPQLHLLTPVFARDAAGERQLVRLGHYLNPPDGFDMAAAPQRAGSLVVPSPRALGGGERSGSGAARHLNVDRELSGDVVELDRASCGSGELRAFKKALVAPYSAEVNNCIRTTRGPTRVRVQ